MQANAAEEDDLLIYNDQLVFTGKVSHQAEVALAVMSAGLASGESHA